ncbi:MAG TPA: hypothetical protein VK066_27595 [Chloroflexota bacterium]|nr:hypothetical protein [Chloroflexota bacterium]
MWTRRLATLTMVLLLGTAGCATPSLLGFAPPSGPERGGPSGPLPGDAPAPPAASRARPAPAAPASNASVSRDDAPASTAADTSEREYLDAVRPLLQRLRDNGRDSMRLLDTLGSRSRAADVESRATTLKEQVDELQGEVDALTPPARYQRAHDDLQRALASQRDFLDSELQAYAHRDERTALRDALDRAGDQASDAMHYYAAASDALGILP